MHFAWTARNTLLQTSPNPSSVVPAAQMQTSYFQFQSLGFLASHFSRPWSREGSMHFPNPGIFSDVVFARTPKKKGQNKKVYIFEDYDLIKTFCKHLIMPRNSLRQTGTWCWWCHTEIPNNLMALDGHTSFKSPTTKRWLCFGQTQSAGDSWHWNKPFCFSDVMNNFHCCKVVQSSGLFPWSPRRCSRA